MVREFGSYEEFFPFYVSAHSRPATRWLHFAGTHLGVAAAVTALVRRRPAELLAVPLITCDARLASAPGHKARIELLS